jgi:phage tail-like protein
MAGDNVINRFSTLATDPLRSFRFRVEFSAASDGVFNEKLQTKAGISASTTAMSTGFVGGFTSISGLNITTQAIQYREGGYNTTVHQVPGMTTFTPITMQRGVLYGNDQALTWMRGLFAAASGDGLSAGVGSGKGFRVNIKIYVMDHPNTAANNTPRMGFDIRNAWITQLNYTDLNANDGAILFESMNLVHEGLSVFFTDGSYAPQGVSSTDTAARAAALA